MKTTLHIENAIADVTITDEHSASSYGVPVAVVNGEAYGPGEALPIWPDDELSWLVEPARTTVAAAVIRMDKNGEDISFVKRFLI